MESIEAQRVKNRLLSLVEDHQVVSAKLKELGPDADDNKTSTEISFQKGRLGVIVNDGQKVWEQYVNLTSAEDRASVENTIPIEFRF